MKKIFKKKIDSYVEMHSQTLRKLQISGKIENYTKLIQNCLKKNNNIFVCGNGGSAANSVHIASDLSTIINKNKKRINCISFNSNLSEITCIGNDIGYDQIFSEQLKAHGKKNDLLIVLSGSGNSKNILKVLLLAKKMKINSVGILGFKGGKAKSICDMTIDLNVDDMEVSEDFQLIVHHMSKKLLME